MKPMIAADLLTIAKPLPRYAATWTIATAGTCLLTGCAPVTVLFVGFLMPHMLALTLYAADEKNGWSAYRQALPLTRTGAVCGRYAVIAMLGVLSAALGALAYAAACALAAATPNFTLTGVASLGFDAAGLATYSCIGFVVLLVIFAIVLPLTFSTGSMRVLQYLSFLFLLAIGVFIGPLANVAQTMHTMPGSIALLLLAALALYGASGALALRRYRRRDL